MDLHFTLMLTACGHEVNLPASQENADQGGVAIIHQSDPTLEFQREVIPVLEAAKSKQFPKNDNGDAFFDQATYYFDNGDVNHPKLVFLVHRENTIEIKGLRKELEEKLGDKVVFKKARHNPKVLRDMTKEVADYVAKFDHQGRSHAVGVHLPELASAMKATGQFNRLLSVHS